ncbi:hypothetical protein EUTSA_v10027284mg [Eutrema salsugineum]|uniref:F-box domain-containing protein n=1 Tax=Eutrema salsugineum TaxID=72664 RepID=V4LZP8_EUTSA|nr:hypothetical protein EUTSA_v10027284mg [Eutrema salsugineum]
MDRINNLPDDLLLKIVSSLPTKNIAATMLLSKRWMIVWKMLPRLDFDDGHELELSKYERFIKFVDRSLVLNRAPVLEALKFVLGPCSSPKDLATWIRIGMARHVRELEIRRCEGYSQEHKYIPKMPKSLYTYEKLEVLKLSGCVILNVPVDVCFPSLKTLHLIRVEHETNESLLRLLSGCLVLEDLVLDKTYGYGFPSVVVQRHTLQRLSILDTYQEAYVGQGFHVILICVSSLKYLNFVDYFGDLHMSGDMPEVVEAHVRFVHKNPEMLLKSIPSVKHLCLCLTASMLQHRIVFHHLVHLELCPLRQDWWDLLTWMLESSPKLQVLEISECDQSLCLKEPIIGDHWAGPSSVPECLMSHLHTFKWNDYRRRSNEKEIVAYVLKNATQLQTVSISVYKYDSEEERFQKLNELVSLPIASSSSRLLLD